MRERLRISGLLICLSWAAGLFAQRAPRIPVVFLDVQHGLSNNTVRCIARDHNGFLWFGTRDGLNRYDGNAFTVYRHQFKDSNSLICNYILTLCEDKAGRLYIGTRQGLSIYDHLTGRFSTLSWMSPGDHRARLFDGVIKQVSCDAQGDMLIGTEDLGLFILRKGAAFAVPVYLADGSRYGVHAIKVDGGRVWVLVQKKGLCLLDVAAGRLTLVNTQLPLAGSLEVIDGVLWTGSGDALYRYEASANVFARVWECPAWGHMPDDIWMLRKDDRGGLLLGTLNGRVLRWSIAAGKIVQEPLNDSAEALGNGTVYDVYSGDGGSKWIATAKGGVGVVDPERERFHTLPRQTGAGGAPVNFVTSFAETPDSNLWIGTEGNGILVYNRKKESFTNLGSPYRRQVEAGKVINMCLDYTGHIWTAGQAAGIDRIDPATGRVEHYYCNQTSSGLESNWVWMIYEDRKKDMWATTLRQVSLMGALYRFDRTGDRWVAFDTSLSDLFTLYEDRAGTLWGGSLGQLVAIDRAGRRHRRYPVDFPVRCIYEDGHGRLWLGTEGGGLLLFDRSLGVIISRYTTDEGLCNNSVNSILEDRSGDLWVSTANGLSKFDVARAQFRNYFASDGLQSNEFIYNAALELRSGEFVFGGIKGFNLFDPMTIRETDRMPKLLLTGITVNGVSVEKDPSVVSRWGADQAEEIRVPYDKAFFSFDFTALEFSAPKQIGYSYFMDGWDRKWTDAGNQHKAAYTHLSEGHYVFRVRSTNAEGKWGSREVALSVVVLPPWFRTWWAYTIYLLVAGLLLWVYRRYRVRQVRLKYEIDIARMNAEKERSEHEKKLSFFTNISHEFRTPLTLIINPVKDLLEKAWAESGEEQAELNIIHRNARRMLSLVDQLLLFRKAESGVDRLNPARLNLCELSREIYLSFLQQAKAKNIRYEFSCEDEALEVVADREKIEIVLFNLVSNAMKYTPADGAVSLGIAGYSDHIEVRVADTGPGISAEAGSRIFEPFYQAAGTVKPGFGIGLYLARQFALVHKGDLTYTSAEGGGTVFTLSLMRELEHPGVAMPADPGGSSELFRELVTDEEPVAVPEPGTGIQPLVDEKTSVLIVDDDPAMRAYIAGIFREKMTIYEAGDGKEGIRLALAQLPDLIISDVKMEGATGIDLCRIVKAEPAASHIPVVLLTGTTGLELAGVEGGADLYLSKPFDRGLLEAKVANLLQSRNNLRKALFNEITHNEAPRKISAADKEFLERCTALVEKHIDEEEFAIKDLALEMGISHSALYKKIKALSGHSLNAFIRHVRLRNAAILCINTQYNVNEIAVRVGILDRTHFREQFQKVYGMTAAEYIRKYRKPLTSQYVVRKEK
ncbi:MAG: response regulator [Bacteroidetes bacterium]|nr:response regulator [Bacteroidota bacterium]